MSLLRDSLRHCVLSGGACVAMATVSKKGMCEIGYEAAVACARSPGPKGKDEKTSIGDGDWLIMQDGYCTDL